MAAERRPRRRPYKVAAVAAARVVDVDPSTLAAKNGPQMLRTTAMNTYGLTPAQLDSIKPVQVKENPHDHSKMMRFYNRRDVEALAASLNLTKVASSSNNRRRAPRYYDEDRNVFENMSQEEADDHLAAMTGISMHSFH